MKKGKLQFKVPVKKSKYRQIQYDPVSYKKHQHLRLLDDREQYLVERYRTLLTTSDALLFYHGTHMAPNETYAYRQKLYQMGIGMEFVCRRPMTGAMLYTDKYENLIPLIQGPSWAFWPSQFYQKKQPSSERIDDFMAMSGILKQTDCASFVKDLQRVFAKERRMVLLGGMVEDSLMAAQELQQYAALPAKSTVESDLVGTLNGTAMQMTSLLSSHSKQIISILDLHSKSQKTKQHSTAQ